MALDREVQMIAADRRRPVERVRAAARLVLQARTIKAYRRLFLKGGKLTPDGALVLEDLARAAGMGKVRAGGTSEEMNFREGRRAIVLHAFARMDAATLEKLAQRIREANTDDDTDA